MPQRIICVWTANDAAATRALYTADDTIISFDLDASALLERAGLPFFEAHHLLSMAEIDAFQTSADELTRTWYQPIEADCVIEGVSPLAMEQRTLYTFSIMRCVPA